MRSRGFGVRGLLIGSMLLSASCGGSDEGALGGQNSGNGGDGTSGASGASGSSTTGGTTGNGGSTTGNGGSMTTGNGGSVVGAGGAVTGNGGRMSMAGTNGGGMGGMSADCPATEPMNTSMCTTATPMGTMGCPYSASGDVCVCRGRMGNLTWRCAAGVGGRGGVGGMGGAAGAAGGGGVGGNATNCPMAAPMAGDMCTRATGMTQSNTCRYGTDVCTCLAPTMTMTTSTWACLTCPATMPMTGDDCTEEGSCRYNQRTCQCRTPIGGDPDAGSSMTWVCR